MLFFFQACLKLIARKEDLIFDGAEWKERSDGELIAEVFQLADKYDINDLKAILEKHYTDKRLNLGNVVSMAVLADTHSAEKLNEVGGWTLEELWFVADSKVVPLVPSRHASSSSPRRGRSSTRAQSGRS
jgi:hypothetical protein